MAGPGCRLLRLACVTLALTAECAAVTGKHFLGVNKEAAARGKESVMLSYFLPQDTDGCIFIRIMFPC